MVQSNTYTFYFELFGQKKKWSVEADSHADARKALDSFLLSKLNIVRGEGPAGIADAEKKEPVDHLFDLFEKLKREVFS